MTSALNGIDSFRSPINFKMIANKTRQKGFNQNQFCKQVINFQKTSIFYNDPNIVQNSINKIASKPDCHIGYQDDERTAYKT